MPFLFYRDLGDADLEAIVAFLRSVAPVKNETPESVYNLPLPPSYGPPVESVTAPERGPTADYGEYLAGPVAHCMECHTRLGPAGPMISTHLGSGGNEFHGPWGTSVSSNLTPHADGLAGRSDEELITMIRMGIRDGKPMLPPMGYAYYANMTDEAALPPRLARMWGARMWGARMRSEGHRSASPARGTWRARCRQTAGM